MDKDCLNRQKGQVLLIVVLIMVVSVTIGLSIASRSITSFKSSTEQAESQKALAAAEAGIEQAIKSSASVGEKTLSNSTSFTSTITEVSGSSFLLNGGNLVPKNDGFDLWLSKYSSDSAEIYTNPWSGGLTLFWGDQSGACENAAIEVAIIMGPDRNDPVIKRYAFDPCSTRRNSNNFTEAGPGGTVTGNNFAYSAEISGITSGFFARIIPLYTGTRLGVTVSVSSPALPPQGSVISSTGQAGETQRKVTVFQGYPEVPAEFFPYSLFSP